MSEHHDTCPDKPVSKTPVDQRMQEQGYRPNFDDGGVGLCSHKCPQFVPGPDSTKGGRCSILGERPEYICEPWARDAAFIIRRNLSHLWAATYGAAFSVMVCDYVKTHGVMPKPEAFERIDLIAKHIAGRARR